ncbi:MAG: hypothetical protein NZ697_00720 [Porticoccaceae bacterium]|nr:hypothetical protein [Porticoccaceae bacterium]
MPLKTQIILCSLQENSKTLQRFALALRPQSVVPALAKGYGHYLRAAPCLATLFLSANPVSN